MIKHILTKQQRAAGLDTWEDDHYLYIEDSKDEYKLVAVFSSTGTIIKGIQQAADEYLLKRGKNRKG